MPGSSGPGRTPLARPRLRRERQCAAGRLWARLRGGGDHRGGHRQRDRHGRRRAKCHDPAAAGTRQERGRQLFQCRAGDGGCDRRRRAGHQPEPGGSQPVERAGRRSELRDVARRDGGGGAGNSGTEGALYPAKYAGVVAVGSVDQDLQHSSFSNYGPDIDLWAPGRDILSATRDGGYGLMSGTSFAAPQVAAVGALESAWGRSLTLNASLVSIGGSSGSPSPEPSVSPTVTLLPTLGASPNLTVTPLPADDDLYRDLPHVPGELLLKLDTTTQVNVNTMTSSSLALNNVLSSVGVQEFGHLYRSPGSETATSNTIFDQYYIVKFSAGVDVFTVAKQFDERSFRGTRRTEFHWPHNADTQ